MFADRISRIRALLADANEIVGHAAKVDTEAGYSFAFDALFDGEPGIAGELRVLSGQADLYYDDSTYMSCVFGFVSAYDEWAREALGEVTS